MNLSSSSGKRALRSYWESLPAPMDAVGALNTRRRACCTVWGQSSRGAERTDSSSDWPKVPCPHAARVWMSFTSCWRLGVGVDIVGFGEAQVDCGSTGRLPAGCVRQRNRKSRLPPSKRGSLRERIPFRDASVGSIVAQGPLLFAYCCNPAASLWFRWS